MSSDLYAKLNDAGRTALEIVRRERAGDLRGIVNLIGTYSEGDTALIIGAMASVINNVLDAFDVLASSQGEPVRGEDLLNAMAVSLQPPESGLDHG